MIGDALRKARKDANMTQNDLAKKIGVQRSVISKYESGAIDPTFSQIQSIANALNIDLMLLLGCDTPQSSTDAVIDIISQYQAILDVILEDKHVPNDIKQLIKESSPHDPMIPVSALSFQAETAQSNAIIQLSDNVTRLPIFAERFVLLRGKKTQEEFANYLGISRVMVESYEDGSQLPNVFFLQQISKKCQVSADWLLGLSDVREQNGEVRQVCNYTGLSESSVTTLHGYVNHFNGHITNIVSDLINTLLIPSRMNRFCNFAWRSAISSIAEMKLDKKLLEYEDIDVFDRYEEMKKISDELFSPKNEVIFDKTNKLTAIPYGNVSLAYRAEAAQMVERTAKEVILDYTEKMNKAIEKK